MLRPRRLLLVIVMLAGICAPVKGETVRIENPAGGIAVRVVEAGNPVFRRKSPTRPLRADDVTVAQRPGLILLRAQPVDNAPINIEADIPYGFDVQALTKDGAISYSGFLSRVDLLTETGDISVASPWNATRLHVQTQDPPEEYLQPNGHKFAQTKTGGGKSERPRWSLRDKLGDLHITYSRISINGVSPGRLALEDMPIPETAPVKLPWQAQGVLDQLRAVRKPAKRAVRPTRRKQEQPESEEGIKAITVQEGIPVFSSNVRMVNLTASIYDQENHPMLDLKAEDFVVVENGVEQEVQFAGSEEVPFNLALLLDLSGSTRNDRDAMKEAAVRFVDIARPQDRVAAYALSNNMFQVVSPLTADRDHLKELIELIPRVSGGSPLYDVIALSYAQEFRQVPTERNALIVISDGIDNRIHGVGAASQVSFKELREAAAGMNTSIYPVFLDPFTAIPAPGWAKKAKSNMAGLAQATGGRLFAAQSIRDLDPVYPLVAEELRSVYTIAYYPKDQAFDGGWREVEVRVKRPGASVRTRDGYFAK